MKAETFSSGEEFLDTLSSTASYRPACVILDFQMQGINGLKLQRRLAPTGVPVIFITAHNDPAVREKALAAGAAGLSAKPFSDARLVKVVDIALSLRGPKTKKPAPPSRAGLKTRNGLRTIRSRWNSLYRRALDSPQGSRSICAFAHI